MLQINRAINFNFRFVFTSRLISYKTASTPNEKNTINEIISKKIGITTGEQNRLVKECPEAVDSMRLLKVAIIGAPNAGKSSLSNKLVGWKYSAVSEKVHTTRKSSLGVLTEADSQVVFVDTPGVIVPAKTKKHNLESSLLVEPHEALQQADLIGVVVDVGRLWNRTHLDTEVLKMLSLHRHKPSILILNKVDLCQRKEELLNVVRVLTQGCLEGRAYQRNKKDLRKQHAMKTEVKKDAKDATLSYRSANDWEQWLGSDDAQVPNEFEVAGNKTWRQKELERHKERGIGTEGMTERHNLREPDGWDSYYKMIRQIGVEEKGRMGWDLFSEVFMVSAKEGDGVFELRNYLLDSARPAAWHFSNKVVTDQSPRSMAEQIVWEKLLDMLPKEIPYQIKVKIAMWHVGEDNLLRAQFDLLCSRKRTLHHLMGKKGATIRAISMQVKQELMNAFKRDMTLQLIIKITNKNIVHFRKEKPNSQTDHPHID